MNTFEQIQRIQITNYRCILWHVLCHSCIFFKRERERNSQVLKKFKYIHKILPQLRKRGGGIHHKK